MDLVFDSVRKKFGDTLAVEIPHLTIRQGEFFTFVGPSGCGKSTTLNLIAGLEAPTAGTLELGGRRLNDLPPQKRDVAFVFQTYALYPHRTVFDNVAFPLQLAGTSTADIRRRVLQTARLLGLEPLLDKYPRHLSGGERQRVALGRAIVREPKLFLFDEPLSNLDAPLRAQMRRELRRLHQQLGTTFIYVTHDQEEALSLSDRIAVIHEGRILQCGSAAEIYSQPANTFVASFFGSPPMNLIKAALATGPAGVAVRIGERRIGVTGPGQDVLNKGTVTVGIRPEHVRLGREPEEAGWRAKVVLVERRGSQTIVEVETGGFSLVSVESPESGYREGDTVWLSIDTGQVHLFDSETGQRSGSASA